VIAGQVLSLVQSEQVDFGVMGGTVKASDVETVFEAQDRLHVVYPRGHRIARLKTIAPAVLAEFPLILMHRDTSVRAIVDAGFHAAGLSPKATCEAIYMMTAVGMVRAGLGLTILPGSAREIKAEPGLRSKPIDDPTFTRPVSIITRIGRTLPPLSQAFLEHLSIYLSAELAQGRAFPSSRRQTRRVNFAGAGRGD
jgi:DNA-binding transcriptional LysR family regulator